MNTIGLGFNVPIAYIYEAGIHCRDCTQKRFGTNSDGYIALTDNGAARKDKDNNEVRPVFLWSEYHHNSCDDCHTKIGE